jgi:hypothetical protein
MISKICKRVSVVCLYVAVWLDQALCQAVRIPSRQCVPVCRTLYSVLYTGNMYQR